MNILAIETSGSDCSAALWREVSVCQRHEQAPRKHGELLLPMIDELLLEGGMPLHALDAIAFGRGPGSFTGVRIAAAVAQGVAFGGGLPVLGISTLAGLAHAAWRVHPDWFAGQPQSPQVIAAIDARISEIYWGLFEVTATGTVSSLRPEAVSAPESVALVGHASSGNAIGLTVGAGNAWALYSNLLRDSTGLRSALVDASLVCTAEDIAELAAVSVAKGEVLPPEQGLPLYLRDQVAVKPEQPARLERG